MARPSSPTEQVVPLPATVEMMPLETFRIRWLAVSAMYSLPVKSTVIALAEASAALLAVPLSPLKPQVPFPAMVVMMPLDTLRMRFSELSAMYKLPAESTAMPIGLASEAFVARLPSPLLAPICELPLPVTVVIVPFDTLRIR